MLPMLIQTYRTPNPLSLLDTASAFRFTTSSYCSTVNGSTHAHPSQPMGASSQRLAPFLAAARSAHRSSWRYGLGPGLGSSARDPACRRAAAGARAPKVVLFSCDPDAGVAPPGADSIVACRADRLYNLV